MEMDLPDRDAVRVGLRRGNEAIHGERVRFHLVGQTEAFDQRTNPRKAVMVAPVQILINMRVLELMRMRVLVRMIVVVCVRFLHV